VCRRWLPKINAPNNCPCTSRTCIGRAHHFHCDHETTNHASKWRCSHLNAKQPQQVVVYASRYGGSGTQKCTILARNLTLFHEACNQILHQYTYSSQHLQHIPYFYASEQISSNI
jgi:hypothetical protein